MVEENNIAIRVEHVSKTFHLPKDGSQNLRNTLVNRFKGIKGYTEQHVLKDIDFSVEKGDFFGIVGRNGSGKSTLLKIISQIYTPEQGRVTVNGKLVSFIELGVGFNPELTGRENVYLNGAMLGFSVQEIDAMYDDIVEFAELRDFMHQKLKNYSSGMQVRLAFSVAIKADSDILVLDEVLAVGDEAFQRKCYNYFAQLKHNKKTVILVTHSMDSVQQFCNKAIMIENGKVVHSGNVAMVAQSYRELFMDKGTVGKKGQTEIVETKDVSSKVECKVLEDKVQFDINIMPKSDIEDPVITFLLNRDNGEIVYRWVTDEKFKEKINLKRNLPIKIQITIDNIFPNGIFNVQLGIKKSDRSIEYAMFNEIAQFEIINNGSRANDIYWKPTEISAIIKEEIR
ncbi:MAG TPA: ABC transporter ATP-binding protein [Lactovum miscens]|uniref:ABC transporter ATP-binding protein n=1 Tax=Lactovum miscens TaxID=190387 RepID=UPI002ED971FA